MHPEVTWELDITLPEENLLMNMRKTTRYLIRQAEKNPDIEIVKSQNPDDLKLFWPVYLETAKRHRFVVFSEKYLKTEFDIFSKDKEILLFLGKHKGEVVSGAIFIFWQDMCFYHHSGSLSKYNKIPVSYLLQWEAIKEARNRHCKTYNFWGIAPDITEENTAVKSRHPWAGLSLFKMGFGGYKKEYVKTHDFVISSKYWLNYIIEVIRKRKRNL
jgi:lipid II:glycine glycyltransferase (peptidoglycan interpeptide bridge formation enzyme)